MEHGTQALAQGLITAWSLVAVTICALVAVVFLAIRRRAQRVNPEEAIRTFRSLDIEAFRNLVNSEEEAFLRINLAPRKFREIKRQRAWAALLYAWEAGAAARALAEVGQAAQRSSDPKIAASGAQVAESAFRLRLQTMGACLHFLTEILLPGFPGRSVAPLVDQYEQTAKTVFLLRRSSGVHSFTKPERAVE